MCVLISYNCWCGVCVLDLTRKWFTVLYVSLRWCCWLDSQLRWAQIFLVCPHDFLGSSRPLIRDRLLFHTFTCSRKVALMPRSKTHRSGSWRRQICAGCGAEFHWRRRVHHHTPDPAGRADSLHSCSWTICDMPSSALMRQGSRVLAVFAIYELDVVVDNLDWLTHRCRSCLPSSCAWVWAGESPAWTTASLCWSLKTPTTNWLWSTWFLVWRKIVLSRRGTELRECTWCSALALSMRRTRVTLSMPSYWWTLSKPWAWLKSGWQLFSSRVCSPWSWLKLSIGRQ